MSAIGRKTILACELGDVRRTRRAVTVARQMAEHPDGSTPDQAEDGSDLKAIYRLFNADEASFTALATPPWRHTRSLAHGTVLLIGDTTETDFGIRRAVTGLGPTGDGYGLGFFLHSSMMVDAGRGEILGLAGQERFYRQPAPKNENSYRALQRSRESEVWGRVVEEADEEQVGERDGAKRLSLRAVLAKQPLSGTYELSVGTTKDTRRARPACKSASGLVVSDIRISKSPDPFDLLKES